MKFNFRFKLKRKKIVRILLLSIVALVVTIALCNYAVELRAKKYIYDSVDEIPANKVGLVLGTAKHLSNGRLNYYFVYRIQAAVRLYKAGKIKRIIVSGDNHIKGYNEPEDMELELIKNGIPASAIYKDYAGFRTLDSVVRSSIIFGQSSITIISQQFHNERAIYIARNKGLKVVGYNAKNVSPAYRVKTSIRELFARVKMIIDLHLINKKPKFGGDRIHIS